MGKPSPECGRMPQIPHPWQVQKGSIRQEIPARKPPCLAKSLQLSAREPHPGTRRAHPGTRRARPGTRQADPGTRRVSPGTRGARPGTRQVSPGSREANLNPNDTRAPPDAAPLVPGSERMAPKGSLVVPGAICVATGDGCMVPGEACMVPGQGDFVSGGTLPGRNAPTPFPAISVSDTFPDFHTIRKSNPSVTSPQPALCQSLPALLFRRLTGYRPAISSGAERTRCSPRN